MRNRWQEFVKDVYFRGIEPSVRKEVCYCTTICLECVVDLRVQFVVDLRIQFIGIC